MKKSLKGLKWRKNSPIKGSLNEVPDGQEIVFVEGQTGNKERVKMVFHLQSQSQYALYGEEFKGQYASDGENKKVDITIFIADEERGQAAYFLADVKSTIGGKDVILHLIEQWRDGKRYLNNEILGYLKKEVNLEEHVMVITQCFDEERIQREIELLRKEDDIQPKNDMIAKKQLLMSGNKERKELEELENFILHKFRCKENGEYRLIPFEVGLLELQEDATYLYNMIIELK